MFNVHRRFSKYYNLVELRLKDGVKGENNMYFLYVQALTLINTK